MKVDIQYVIVSIVLWALEEAILVASGLPEYIVVPNACREQARRCFGIYRAISHDVIIARPKSLWTTANFNPEVLRTF